MDQILSEIENLSNGGYPGGYAARIALRRVRNKIMKMEDIE
jgi:hypothetical protein